MTANRIYYAIAAALSVFFFTALPCRVSVALLCAVIIMPLMSLVLLLSAYAGVEVHQGLNCISVYKGEKVRVNVYARCARRLSFAFADVRVRRAEPDAKCPRRADVTMCASFGHPVAVGFDVSCRYRGAYMIGASEVRLYDLLGLFCLKKKMSMSKVTVYPRIYSVVGLTVDNRLIGQTSMTKNSLKKDDILISHVRDYQSSDRPKSIHWKASSKLNKLMVKDYEPLKEVGVYIVMDTEKKSGERDALVPREDKIIEAAVSLASCCLSEMLTAKVVYTGPGVISREINELQDFPPVYSALACMEFCGDDVVKTVRSLINERTGGSNLMVVTDRSDDQLRALFRLGSTAGYKMTLIRISDSTDEDKCAEQLRGFIADGIKAVHVSADRGDPIVF